MNYKVGVCVFFVSLRAGYLCSAGLIALLKKTDYKVSVCVCVTPCWLPVRSSAQEDGLQGEGVCVTSCWLPVRGRSYCTAQEDGLQGECVCHSVMATCAQQDLLLCSRR